MALINLYYCVRTSKHPIMQDKIHLGITTPTPSSFSESVGWQKLQGKIFTIYGREQSNHCGTL